MLPTTWLATTAGSQGEVRRHRVGSGPGVLLYSWPLAQGGHMDGHGKAFAYFALFTEIGLALFVTTLGGALAGRWLDEQLGTTPFFIIVGFLLGALLGAVADWRLISRFLERLKD